MKNVNDGRMVNENMSKRWTDSERTMSVQWKNKLKNRTLLATNIIQ